LLHAILEPFLQVGLNPLVKPHLYYQVGTTDPLQPVYTASYVAVELVQESSVIPNYQPTT